MSYERGKYQRLLLQTFDPLTDATYHTPPTEIWQTRRKDGVWYVAGKGNMDSPDIMFIAPTLFEEEAQTGFVSENGKEYTDNPEYLKGPSGSILKTVCQQEGIDIDKQYYTAMCKHLLPRHVRNKLKKTHIEWGMPALRAEIDTVKPKVIVCLGKAVFDALYPMKFKMTEIEGGFFDYKSESHNCLLVPTESIYKMVNHPDMMEKMRTNLQEVTRMLRNMSGRVEGVKTDYREVRTIQTLRDTVDEIIESKATRIAFDCEWGGQTYLDGQLRMTQISWKKGVSAAIVFTAPASKPNGVMPYVFDASYKEAGAELARLLRYIPGKCLCGHQASADMPWWIHVLGVDCLDRVGCDTLYAQQCADEYSDGKLERLSCMYTDLGRYDIPLAIYKKENKISKDEGYSSIPDDILIPYACKDADTTFRASYEIEELIRKQGMKLWFYWQKECLPFVTEMFTRFTMNGLYMDRAAMDETRALFIWARDELSKDFGKAIVNEAYQLAAARLAELSGLPLGQCENIIQENARPFDDVFDGNKKKYSPDETTPELTDAWNRVSSHVPPESLVDFRPFWDHVLSAPYFNIRSKPHMVRWLFKVKGYIPIKTTGNKDNGMPAMSWEKLMTMPADKQRLYSPASDKNTLAVYAARGDDLIEQLLQLNLVGNITKAFLKPSEIIEGEDGEDDEEVEDGLHAWICSDGRIHGNFSLTESARPRAWNPNTLNLPSYVNERIKIAIKELCVRKKAAGLLPSQFERYVTEEPLAVRCHAVAAPGNMIVESDFCTAEVRGLAYMSGDKAMIAAVSEPDSQFALVEVTKTKDGKTKTEKVPVRVSYSPGCGIPEELQDKEILFKLVSDPKEVEGLYASVEGKAPEEGVDLLKWFNLHALKERMAGGAFLKLARKKVNKLCYIELKSVKPEQWVRDADMNLVSPSHDLHWEIVEYVYKCGREVMHKKIERASGKVANFSSAYGASASSLERKIEVDTGVKPEEGTGQALLDALNTKYPVAQQWLRDREKDPETGKQVAYSGRIRHYHLHRGVRGLSNRQYNDTLSPLTREARNFFLQHSVASVSAKACLKLSRYFEEHGMKAKVIALLYDSIVTECPYHERFRVAELHQKFMTDETKEIYGENVLQYPIETEMNIGWSRRPSESVIANFSDTTWNVGEVA